MTPSPRPSLAARIEERGNAGRLWNALNAIGLNPLGKAPGMVEESC